MYFQFTWLPLFFAVFNVMSAFTCNKPLKCSVQVGNEIVPCRVKGLGDSCKVSNIGSKKCEDPNVAGEISINTDIKHRYSPDDKKIAVNIAVSTQGNSGKILLKIGRSFPSWSSTDYYVITGTHNKAWGKQSEYKYQVESCFNNTGEKFDLDAVVTVLPLPCPISRKKSLKCHFDQSMMKKRSKRTSHFIEKEQPKNTKRECVCDDMYAKVVERDIVVEYRNFTQDSENRRHYKTELIPKDKHAKFVKRKGNSTLKNITAGEYILFVKCTENKHCSMEVTMPEYSTALPSAQSVRSGETTSSRTTEVRLQTNNDVMDTTVIPSNNSPTAASLTINLPSIISISDGRMNGWQKDNLLEKNSAAEDIDTIFIIALTIGILIVKLLIVLLVLLIRRKIVLTAIRNPVSKFKPGRILLVYMNDFQNKSYLQAVKEFGTLLETDYYLQVHHYLAESDRQAFMENKYDWLDANIRNSTHFIFISSSRLFRLCENNRSPQIQELINEDDMGELTYYILNRLRPETNCKVYLVSFCDEDYNNASHVINRPGTFLSKDTKNIKLTKFRKNGQLILSEKHFKELLKELNVLPTVRETEQSSRFLNVVRNWPRVTAQGMRFMHTRVHVTGMRSDNSCRPAQV